jgi:hypothetical protein
MARIGLPTHPIRLAATVLLIAGLAGCSGSAEAPATPPPSGDMPSAAASSSLGIPAPIIVEPGQAEVSAMVGETIVFNQPDPANTSISTDHPDLLELSQGFDDGSAQFNPGAVALAPGVGTVTIVAADGTTETVTITVTAP